MTTRRPEDVELGEDLRLLVYRIAGNRTLAQLTAFDFVLLLIVGESTQQALLGNDFSLTNAYQVILTLIGFDIALSLWKQRSPMLDRLIGGVPLVIVEEGRPLKERMDQARVDEADVLAAARLSKGLEQMDQIKYAVLERSGGISIISRSGL